MDADDMTYLITGIGKNAEEVITLLVTALLPRKPNAKFRTPFSHLRKS